MDVVLDTPTSQNMASSATKRMIRIGCVWWGGGGGSRRGVSTQHRVTIYSSQPNIWEPGLSRTFISHRGCIQMSFRRANLQRHLRNARARLV